MLRRANHGNKLRPRNYLTAASVLQMHSLLNPGTASPLKLPSVLQCICNQIFALKLLQVGYSPHISVKRLPGRVLLVVKRC
jgi:hypothetical protein